MPRSFCEQANPRQNSGRSSLILHSKANRSSVLWQAIISGPVALRQNIWDGCSKAAGKSFCSGNCTIPPAPKTAPRDFCQRCMRDFPDTEILCDSEFAGGTFETAYQTSKCLLRRLGSGANGIFTVNELASAGMLLALQEAGLTERGS